MRFLLLAAAATLLLPAWAQDEKEHPPAMKTVNASMKILKASLETKNAAEAGAAAKKVEESIATTRKYWVAKNIKDAMDWSDAALAGAKLAQEGAAAGQWDKVGDGVSKMGGTCKSCHDVHRERLPDGGYKIK